jgi:hypothetical protein
MLILSNTKQMNLILNYFPKYKRTMEMPWDGNSVIRFHRMGSSINLDISIHIPVAKVMFMGLEFGLSNQNMKLILPRLTESLPASA